MAKAENVELLRTRREAVHGKIEILKREARDLSVRIREGEGPIGDRTGRTQTGFTIKPKVER